VAGVRAGPSIRPGDGGPGASLSTIVTRGLTKRYGDLAAVDGLDLTIEQGALYGFLGPNGAGKTTTIRMILGLIFPTSGDAEVLGEPIFGGTAGQRASALRRVGAMIEEPAFWKYLTGRKNLEYVARAAGPPEDRDRRLRRVDEVLRIVGLDQAANKKVKAYSQGMRQRLGIALALSGSPELLVLDEPTNGLDPQGMREIRLLLRRLADDGTTIFVSSHLLAEVEAMCDRVGVLARGKLVAEGAPSKLRASADVLRLEVDDPARARSILSGLEGVSLIDGVPDSASTVLVRLASPASAAGVNAALVTGGVAVSALVPEHESLEDVFVSLVEGADVPR
jgi:ABC-2 type transport system ATP-binding protein